MRYILGRKSACLLRNRSPIVSPTNPSRAADGQHGQPWSILPCTCQQRIAKLGLLVCEVMSSEVGPKRSFHKGTLLKSWDYGADRAVEASIGQGARAGRCRSMEVGINASYIDGWLVGWLVGW